MTDPEPAPPVTPADATDRRPGLSESALADRVARERREAAALRENLRRRKARTRPGPDS